MDILATTPIAGNVIGNLGIEVWNKIHAQENHDWAAARIRIFSQTSMLIIYLGGMAVLQRYLLNPLP